MKHIFQFFFYLLKNKEICFVQTYEYIQVAILILLLSSSLYASSPVSGTIGPVQTSVEEGSITGIALKAASEEYTEAWLDQYAVDKVSFGEAYSSLLSDTLPLSDLIASGERNGAVSVMSLESGTVLSFIFTDGRISAVSLSP